jgi:hypothetical protein
MGLPPEGRLAVLERRADEQDTRHGQLMAAVTEAVTLARATREDLKDLRDELAERPSAVEFQRFQESVRAKAAARPTLPSLSELQFNGPSWLGSFKLQGYSGVTLTVALSVAAVALVAYLILK